MRTFQVHNIWGCRYIISSTQLTITITLSSTCFVSRAKHSQWSRAPLPELVNGVGSLSADWWHTVVTCSWIVSNPLENPPNLETLSLLAVFLRTCEHAFQLMNFWVRVQHVYPRWRLLTKCLYCTKLSKESRFLALRLAEIGGRVICTYR
jgi:hypothetical protein